MGVVPSWLTATAPPPKTTCHGLGIAGIPSSTGSDDGTLGETVEPGVGDDEHQTARLVTSIGEPDLASRGRQPRPSIQASVSASWRLRWAR